VLEKLSALQASIASLKELSLIARQLNEDFDNDSQAVTKEIQEQIRAFEEFQAPQIRIEALQARIYTGREKVNKLGARVEVIRKRAEGWAKVEEQWQEKTRKRIKLFWGLSALALVVLVGLLISQYTPARSQGSGIVDGLSARAHDITTSILDLEKGLINESLAITSPKVLGGLRKTPDDSLEDDPRLKIFDEL
jgi:BMFP domain-containing protein YqiC